MDMESATGQLLVGVLDSLASLFVLPVGIIGPLLLYYDFRIRKEGFDLEMLGKALAQQMGQAAPAAPASPAPPVKPPAVPPAAMPPAG